MSIKVAINGFGRIGRAVLRAGLPNQDIEFVAINDLTDSSTLSHLLKYDSTQGTLQAEVSSTDTSLIIDGKEVRIYREKDPSKIPWSEVGAEIIFECTGLFRDKETASAHLASGARKVIISTTAIDSASFPRIQ